MGWRIPCPGGRWPLQRAPPTGSPPPGPPRPLPQTRFPCRGTPPARAVRRKGFAAREGSAASAQRLPCPAGGPRPQPGRAVTLLRATVPAAARPRPTQARFKGRRRISWHLAQRPAGSLGARAPRRSCRASRVPRFRPRRLEGAVHSLPACSLPPHPAAGSGRSPPPKLDLRPSFHRLLAWPPAPAPDPGPPN